MSGRRSHVRFTVAPPTHGVVRVLSDAEIASVGHDHVSMITREAAGIDERMLLEFPDEATDLLVPVQVAETRPVIISNSVRHAIRVQVLDGSLIRATLEWFDCRNGNGHGPHSVLRNPVEARLAVVVREFPVRLVNCSRSGCLFEVDRPLEAGTAGTLSLVLDGHELADHILVTRCQGIAGAGPLHHVGARLLWVEAPSHHTIRRGLAAVENPV
jgi:hypothetical protein